MIYHTMAHETPINENYDISKYSPAVRTSVNMSTTYEIWRLVLSGAHDYHKLYHPDLSHLHWVTTLLLTQWEYIDFKLLPPNLTSLKIEYSHMIEFNYTDRLAKLETIQIYKCFRIRDLQFLNFPSLTEVNIMNNRLTELPKFSDKITTINCSHNNLKQIDSDQLPKFLEGFSCYENYMTSLPSFPSTIKKIDCGNNDIVNISYMNYPELVDFDCSHNKLTELPKLQNTKLTTFDCSHNELTELPKLQNTKLTTFDCSYNELIVLPKLQNTQLTTVDCSHNKLTKLPDMSDTSVTELDCSHNELTKLSSLSYTLLEFDCSNNKIERIFELSESLTVFNCSFNLLTTLYYIPPYLETLDCSCNHITHMMHKLPSTLTSIDASDNELAKRPNVDELPSLYPRCINLENNPFENDAVYPRYNRHHHNAHHHTTHHHTTHYYDRYSYNRTPYVYTPHGSNDPHCVSICNKVIADL